MSSPCSSPFSQSSFHSSLSPAEAHTPQTAITSPGSCSSINGSPKVQYSGTQIQTAPSQNGYLSPFDSSMSGELEELTFENCRFANKTSTVSPGSAFQLEVTPPVDSQKHTSLPVNYYHEHMAPVQMLAGDMAEVPPFYQTTDDTADPSVNMPYPPTTAYQPYQHTQSSGAYPGIDCYLSDVPPVDPFTYQAEDWYTADGRKVELSPMALQCAMM